MQDSGDVFEALAVLNEAGRDDYRITAEANEYVRGLLGIPNKEQGDALGRGIQDIVEEVARDELYCHEDPATIDHDFERAPGPAARDVSKLTRRSPESSVFCHDAFKNKSTCRQGVVQVGAGEVWTKDGAFWERQEK